MNKNINKTNNLQNIAITSDWAKLPLFDRSKWQRVKFGDVVANVNDTERDPQGAGIERFIGLEHLEPGSLHIRSWGNVADGTTFTRRCSLGQVLFGKRRAYQRKVAVAEFDALVSGDIYVFTPKDKRLLPELLPFLCLSERFFKFAVETSAGSLSPRTNWSHLAEFEFALPSIDQQRRIAEIIWALDEAKQSWITTLNSAKTALTEFSASSYRNVNVVDTTKGIQTARLGDLFEIRTGGTPSRGNSEYWGGDIPWIKTGEINYQDIYDSEEKITELGTENSAARIFSKNSILMALYGQGPTLGRVAHLRINASVNQACAVIFPKSGYNMRYLYHYLVGQYSNIRRLARGASQPNINALIVKDFIIPIPNDEEQSSVATALDDYDHTLSHIEQVISATSTLLVKFTNDFT